MHYACKSGNQKLVEYLVNLKKIDIYTKDLIKFDILMIFIMMFFWYFKINILNNSAFDVAKEEKCLTIVNYLSQIMRK